MSPLTVKHPGGPPKNLSLVENILLGDVCVCGEGGRGGGGGVSDIDTWNHACKYATKKEK